MGSLRTYVLAIALFSILVGCAQAGGPDTAAGKGRTKPDSAVASPVPAPADPGVPATFSLNGAQGRQVAQVVKLVAAYDGGQIDEALGLLDNRVIVSDCDYRQVSVVTFSGRSEAEQWLRQRIRDHDQLQVRSIWNLNAGDPGGPTVGVTWGLRASDSLRLLGFPKGIRPQLAAKIIFNPTTYRIMQFANGPYGGDRQSCRPTVAEPPAAAQTPNVPDVKNGSSDPAPGPFMISAHSAANVAALIRFVTAYDSGEFDTAVSLLTEGVVGADCDHATGRVVSFNGRPEAAGWLAGRLAARDQLDVARVYNASGQPDVVGVAFVGRPNNLAKVIFSDAGIVSLALTGSAKSC